MDDNVKRRFNWPIWTGLILSVAAFFSYFLFFVNFPVTRDVPWASFLLFAASLALLILGWMRARRKLLATVGVLLGAGVFAFFMSAILGSKLPELPNALKVGEKAPRFAALDQELAKASRGVLLVFYRGHW